MTRVGWPRSAEELEALQSELALLEPAPWRLGGDAVVAGAFVARPASSGPARRDPLWAGAVALAGGRPVAEVVVRGRAGGPYVPGLLALREGELLERAVVALTVRPNVVLVDGTGRDHPRRAGIALHLGAVLELPTVGVTVRPLVAEPVDPPPERGSSAPLVLDGEVVGYAVRTRPRARPVFAHAAWRTSAETARDVVLATTTRYRTPEPIRLARRLARLTRARDEGRAPSS